MFICQHMGTSWNCRCWENLFKRDNTISRVSGVLTQISLISPLVPSIGSIGFTLGVGIAICVSKSSSRSRVCRFLKLATRRMNKGQWCLLYPLGRRWLYRWISFDRSDLDMRQKGSTEDDDTRASRSASDSLPRGSMTSEEESPSEMFSSSAQTTKILNYWNILVVCVLGQLLYSCLLFSLLFPQCGWLACFILLNLFCL